MIKLVALDLDNTLYDWVSFFVPAFEAMVAVVEKESRLERADLTQRLQAVHQAHGTTEFAFVLSELDALHDVELLASSPAVLHPAIETFQREARRRLRPYPGVAATLRELKQHGRTLVAYTDAMATYADARLEDLGLARYFDELVATADHELPASDRNVLSYLPVERFARHAVPSRRLLRPDERKPNPMPLRRLLREHDLEPHEVLYVGDSVTRDIPMAQAAGVHDVYAAYGREYDESLWDRLVEVTHWTPDDVARERSLASHKAEPTTRIHDFSEVLTAVARIEAGRLETVGSEKRSVEAVPPRRGRTAMQIGADDPEIR